MNLNHVIDTDVLVIGGGAAGIRAAIEAGRQDCKVLILSASRVGYGNNSAISYGGFSATVVNEASEDSPERHFEDTMTGGCWLNRPFLVRLLTDRVPSEVKALEEMGVRFRRDGDGNYTLAPRGGHSVARRLTTPNNSGMALLSPLMKYAEDLNIAKMDGYKVVRLLRESGCICGALAINRQGEWVAISAKSVVLATGGGGALFPTTTNVSDATGDGYALAYDVGLTLQDMEFVQFVLINLPEPGIPRRLPPSEVFLLKGGKLKNNKGEDLLASSGIKTSFTRDIITKIVAREMLARGKDSGDVFLDLSEIPKEELDQIDGLEKHAVKVQPASHFFMGGIRVDEDLETEIEGLYVAGEVMGGVHGANRLGGNALAETFVFGSMSGSLAARFANNEGRGGLFKESQAQQTFEEMMERSDKHVGEKHSEGDIVELESELKSLMGECAGAVRHRKKIEEGINRLKTLKDWFSGIRHSTSRGYWQLFSNENKLKVSEMILQSALKREESRGAHFREDYASQDDELWRVNTCVFQDENKEMRLSLEPVS
jgi:fumarate reductase (CoM/CoB) subunit A